MPIIISGSSGTTILSGSSMTGSLTITGSLTVSGSNTITNYGSFVSNEGSGDYDFRIESNGSANMLFVDGGNDRVGVGTNAPTSTLSVSGSADVSGSILPHGDNAHNLGSSAKRWANVYTGDLHLKNDRGDWTILEEKDYLCVINNATGKKYKMMLQEIDD